MLATGIAGCGGGGDAGLDPAIAEGNAAPIRKEYAEAGAKRPAEITTAGTTIVPGDSVPAEEGADAAATAVSATGGAMPATGGGSASAADSAAALHSFAQQALAAINQARATARRCGDKEQPAVGPLTWDPRVAYAALLESEWMLEANTFGHAWPNGELVWDRLTMAGYEWRLGDENIAAGFDT
ncbi:MAG: CAP domain-containing protein, partial [Lautropia sp.]